MTVDSIGIRGYSAQSVKQALEVLVREEVLERLAPGVFRLPKDLSGIAHGPWRTLTNEQIGIKPTRLGAA